LKGFLELEIEEFTGVADHDYRDNAYYEDGDGPRNVGAPSELVPEAGKLQFVVNIQPNPVAWEELL